jgi:signal transduction histidine kinase
MIDAGKMELELSEFSLRGAIEDAVDLVVTTAENTKVRVEILCDDRIGNVYADERRIKQVLFNLLTNALRFTGAGGSHQDRSVQARPERRHHPPRRVG